jgi:hypothetical protein
MEEVAGTMLSPGGTLLSPTTPVEKYNDEVREMWAMPQLHEVEGGAVRHELQSPDEDKLDKRTEVF